MELSPAEVKAKLKEFGIDWNARDIHYNLTKLGIGVSFNTFGQVRGYQVEPADLEWVALDYKYRKKPPKMPRKIKSITLQELGCKLSAEEATRKMENLYKPVLFHSLTYPKIAGVLGIHPLVLLKVFVRWRIPVPISRHLSRSIMQRVLPEVYAGFEPSHVTSFLRRSRAGLRPKFMRLGSRRR